MIATTGTVLSHTTWPARSGREFPPEGVARRLLVLERIEDSGKGEVRIPWSEDEHGSLSLSVPDDTVYSVHFAPEQTYRAWRGDVGIDPEREDALMRREE